MGINSNPCVTHIHFTLHYVAVDFELCADFSYNTTPGAWREGRTLLCLTLGACSNPSYATAMVVDGVTRGEMLKPAKQL